jgi:hypothetical protein
MHLGAHWTADVGATWSGFLKEVTDAMQEGAASGATRTQAVQRTWKVVEEQGLEENGVLLFQGA